MILSALFVLAAALEVFLIVGTDHLPNARRRSALETSLRQAQADLQESQKRIDAGRARLIAAVDEADRQRAELRAADQAFEKSQKVVPTLVHGIGEPLNGRCFRAPLAKDLPAAPEKPQQAVWGCRNFVEVWADDADAARTLAARQFQARHGYQIGEFVEIPPRAPVAAEKIAA